MSASIRHDTTGGIAVKDLHWFVRVARSGSLGRVAGEFDITQPELSRSLRKLEARLGTELVARHSTGVRLTSAGETLLDHAEAIIRRLQQATDAIAVQVMPDREAFAGDVHIGLSPSVAAAMVPSMARRVREMWPEATVNLREAPGSVLEEWLVERRVDVALLGGPASGEAIESRPVIQERLVAVAAPHSNMAGGAMSIRFRDLAGAPLLLPSRQQHIRKLVSRTAIKLGLTIRPVFEVDSADLAKSMVRQGMGYAILPASAVREEAARGALRILAIEKPTLTTAICIASLRKITSQHVIEGLIAAISQSLTEGIQSGVWTDAEIVDANRDPPLSALHDDQDLAI